MGKSLDSDVTDMQMFLRHAYTFYNYEKATEEARKEHSFPYLREKEFYQDMMLYHLRLVFEGKSEQEIYRVLLKVLAREL